jgi:large subunit ribosomal protein L15
MIMKLNEVPSIANKKSKRLGKGIGSGKGKTAGRGHKGQKARSGVAIKGFEGGQSSIFMKLPKRGFNNVFRTEYVVLTTDTVANYVKSGVLSTDISKADLIEAGLAKIGDKVKLIMGKDSENINFKIEVDKASKEATKYVK